MRSGKRLDVIPEVDALVTTTQHGERSLTRRCGRPVGFRYNAFVNGLAASPFVPDRFRPRLLRRAGLEIGDGAKVRTGLIISKRPRVRIADTAQVNGTASSTVSGRSSSAPA